MGMWLEGGGGGGGGGWVGERQREKVCRVGVMGL